HLLWEMTQSLDRDDVVIRDGWRSEEVKHSLDLCLACKGCKRDCPVSVDVATYKAEFLSHYYQGRTRPLNAYAFGNIDLWASLASNAPGLVNLTTQLPFLRDVAKIVGGIPPQRRIPAFAPETFKNWFFRTDGWRGGKHNIWDAPGLASFARPGNRGTEAWQLKTGASVPQGSYQGMASAVPYSVQIENGALAPEVNAPPVLLWADTFNNYFLPQTARAAVEVLETAGFRVLVPRANLC